MALLEGGDPHLLVIDERSGVHGLASRVRLTSHEAHEAHESLLDRSSIEELLAATGLQLIVYRRFLARMNQLVVAEPEGARIDT